MSLEDEVAKITNVGRATIIKYGIGSSDNEHSVVADGGLCEPATVTFELGYDLEANRKQAEENVEKKAIFKERPAPCKCVVRVCDSLGDQRFAIPVKQDQYVRPDIRSKLLEVTCNDCHQVYLVADWEDLHTGLLLK